VHACKLDKLDNKADKVEGKLDRGLGVTVEPGASIPGTVTIKPGVSIPVSFTVSKRKG